MKKFLALFVVILLSFSSFISPSLAVKLDDNNWIIIKNLVISQTKLSKIKKWDAYIKAIDKFVDKMSLEKLKKIQTNLSRVSKTETIKNKNTLLVVKYIEAKINSKIYELAKTSTNDVISKKDKVQEKQAETSKKIEEKNIYTAISKDEKEKVKKEVLKLQTNFLDKAGNLMEKFAKELDNQLNVEQTWDLSAKVNFDYDKIWTLDLKLNLDDIEAKSNSLFNSSLKTKLKFILESTIDWKTKNLNLSSNLENINIDWEQYYSFNNFHISDKNWMEELNDIFESLEKLSNENKFVKIWDEQTKKMYNLLQSVNLKTNALFETYGKKWDKYLITPTKYACTQYKEVLNLFWEKWNCEDLEEMKKLWDFYITFSWNYTTIGFEINNSEVNLNSYIKYDEKNIQEINFYVKPKDTYLDWQYISFKYINNSSLNIEFLVEKIDFKFNGKLDSNNRFTEIKSNFKEWKNTANLELKNNKISWDFNFVKQWYDYSSNDWKKIDKFKTSGKISGTTKSDNSLNTLDINYTWKDLIKNIEILKWTLKIENNYFKWKQDYSDDYSKLNLNIDFKYDENYIPTDWNFQAKFLVKNYGTKDFKNVFDMDINIENKNIKWKTEIPGIITINHKGWISNERFNLNNSFSLDKEITKYIVWDEEINWAINFSLEEVSNMDKFKLDSFIHIWWKEVFSANFDSNTTTNKKSDFINIEAPTNFIDYKELDFFKAQEAKARDSARLADLKMIQDVLEIYIMDNWKYPKENSNWCLSDKEWNISDENLKEYFKNWKAPLDQDKTKINAPCNIPWVYAYKTFKKNWIENLWYIISTTMEEKDWNTDKDIDFSKNDYNYYKSKIWWEKQDSKIYSIIN